MNTNHNELRIAVAEAMGLLDASNTKPTIEDIEEILRCNNDRMIVTMLPNGEVRALTDYPSDLNAMHVVEMSLTDEQYQKWHSALVTLRNVQCMPVCKCASATAEQRCIAFLKTIGKFKEMETNL